MPLVLGDIDLLEGEMRRIFVGLFFLVLAGRFVPAAQAELRAGTAVVDISPREWPLHLRGSFHPRLATKVHDPLHVRALVLDDGTTTMALVLVDSCMVHRDLLDSAKATASKAK